MKIDEVNYSLDTTVNSRPSSLRHAHNVMCVPYWLHSILIGHPIAIIRSAPIKPPPLRVIILANAGYGTIYFHTDDYKLRFYPALSIIQVPLFRMRLYSLITVIIIYSLFDPRPASKT